jgi:hypothetical protein
MSYKPQVKVNDNWNGNGLVFATKEEAERSASNLFSRWTLCTAHRAIETDEPVKNALNAEGKLQFLEVTHIEEAAEQVSTYIVPHDVPEGTEIIAEEDKPQTA